MIFVILVLAILVFYWYYKTWGKQDFLNSASRGAKGFAKGFARGMMEERIEEIKRKMNYYTIALLAKIAKSDGRVSEEEADMISQILDANAKDDRERKFLKTSFNEHKENLNDAFYVAKDFIKEVPLPKSERFNVLRVLVFMALIDGELTPKKQEILEQIAKAFDIAKAELISFIQNLSNLKSSKKEMSLDEAFGILELSNTADLNAVKKQYRLLAKKYHPDILNANNVSEEEIKQGVEKFQKINKAYEKIKKYLEKG
ncbi:molecular chaperone DjiA [Campylobacter volucris]|uniref:Molecular chaperone DjiA n=1 Tax=Campylobacter volucris TaxID=1031542 RepID=A0AAE5YI29_9BACT|nr:molecular chaperone DjiA [Campylobacter volucris]AJC93809.1 DnaJ-like membrane chaperone protein (N-terminal terB-like domain) [Campylobacter volucris LMG 24379]KAB0579099.1 molecular chaperone DjiA [Campylobacter volucris]MBF7043292.1 molecular chaperone DjiA [Campylobacter volucris]MBF7046069.1 molecular chaperone DjiA [Campylobacter volucris]MBF7067224.1 molecular chaperone DjiA [Campylobacter volucris]